MTVAISIRRAVLTDAAALAELTTQLGYAADPAALQRRLAQVRNDAHAEILVAADADDRILGWTHVAGRTSLEDEPFAELCGLIVAERARTRGIGAQLLDAAETWARRNGYPKLRVRSNVVRERAHRFYLREGYFEVKRQVVFDKALD